MYWVMYDKSLRKHLETETALFDRLVAFPVLYFIVMKIVLLIHLPLSLLCNYAGVGLCILLNTPSTFS